MRHDPLGRTLARGFGGLAFLLLFVLIIGVVSATFFTLAEAGKGAGPAIPTATLHGGGARSG